MKTGRSASSEDGPIVDEILEWIGSGRTPNPDQLKRLFPGRETAVDRLCNAAKPYVALKNESRPKRSGLRPGIALGDFVVESLLAEGGMGVVYRARQRSLGDRIVALKVLAAEDVSDTARARFRREALLAASLHHPNLTEVYGFGESDGFFYYAMRLLEGPSLRDALAKLASTSDAPRSAKVRRIVVARMAEVAAGLGAVHDAGLVHRDVKPANIILDEARKGDALGADGRAVLVDFGLVRAVDAEVRTRPEDASATPAYASPEQALGKEVDARTDVFSLGATLHDLLAGRLPSERGRASAGLQDVRDLVPDVDLDLAAIVGKAIELEPAWRYSNADSFRADLEAWLAGESVSARRLGLVERSSRWVRRNPNRILGYALRSFLALVVMLAALLLWNQVDLARKAEQDFREGNIASLCARLQAHGGFSALLLDPELQRIRRTLREEDRTDPIVRVKQLIAGGRMEEALSWAATQAEREGIGSHSLLDRFLLRALDPTSGSSASGGKELRSHAVYVVAHLFHRAPIANPDEAEACRVFRNRLLELLDTVDDQDRHYVLTALSGCGTPDILVGLIERAERIRTNSEEYRLTFMAAERILLRARRIGIAGRLTDDQVGKLVRVSVSQLKDSLAHSIGNPERWWGPWLCAVAFLERDRGRSLADSVGPFDLSVHAQASRLAAAMRSPGMVETCLKGRGLFDLDLNPQIWGWCCGALDDPEVNRAIEAGRIPGADKGEFESARRLAFATNAEDTARGSQDLDWTLAETAMWKSRSSGQPAEAPIVAAWHFGTVPAVCDGEAHGVVVTPDSRQWRGGPPGLRLDPPHTRFLPRRSEVRLSFTWPDEHHGRQAIITISHLAMSNRYFPLEGFVNLEFQIDGLAPFGSHLVTWEGYHPSQMMVGPEILTAGDHTLVIRATEGTTDYVVETVRLARFPP